MGKKNKLSSISLIEYYESYTRSIYVRKDQDDIYNSLFYALSIKSKKLHPLLVLHASQLFDGDLAHSLPGAIVVELFYNSMLVHGDIMYGKSLRENIPTVHKKYSLGTAINTGDLLIIMAYQQLTTINDTYFTKVLNLFNQTTTRIMEGQSMDLKFKERDVVDLNEYIGMIELRSSLLVAFSLKLGALLAGASKKDQELMFELGRNLGLCYHIQKDWLRVYGNGSTGKNHRDDVILSTKNFLYLKAWELADKNQKQQLLKLQNGHDEQSKIEDIIRLYDTLEIGKMAEAVIDHYFASAIECLEALPVGEDNRLPFYQFMQAIHTREFSLVEGKGVNKIDA